MKVMATYRRYERPPRRFLDDQLLRTLETSMEQEREMRAALIISTHRLA